MGWPAGTWSRDGGGGLRRGLDRPGHRWEEVGEAGPGALGLVERWNVGEKVVDLLFCAESPCALGRGWGLRGSTEGRAAQEGRWLVAERLAPGWSGRACTLTVTAVLRGLIAWPHSHAGSDLPSCLFCKYRCCELWAACFFSSLCCRFLCMCTQEWDCSVSSWFYFLFFPLLCSA